MIFPLIQETISSAMFVRARARVQLVGIILSIVLCLPVREQQQQQDAEDEVDSAAEKKGGHRRLSDEEPAA